MAAGNPQALIYMLHNKTDQPMEVWIVLHVQFEHGTKQQLEAIRHRPYRDVSGALFGRTYNVPRQPHGDGRWEYAQDSELAVELTSPTGGTTLRACRHGHPRG